MSQSGEIVFFSKDRSLDPTTLIRRSLEVAGCELVLGVFRSRGEDRGWDQLQASLSGEDDEEGDGGVITSSGDSSDYVAEKVSPKEVPKLYRTGTSLRLLLGESRLGAQLWESLQEAIPESVRGSFVPSGPGVVVGGHDVFESAEHEEGHLFGRAWFSFSLFGYGTPRDWEQYRSLIFDVPAVEQVQRRLEVFAGPMERCVMWSV